MPHCELPAGRALDLGAGPGGDGLWLASRGWHVTTVDISATAARRLQDLADQHGLSQQLRARCRLDLRPAGLLRHQHAALAEHPHREGAAHRVPDATSSPVHERDIAGVAAASLLDDNQRGKSHAVLGAGPSTVREQVAAIARAIEEPVPLVEIDLDAYRKELSAHLPAFAVDRVIEARGDIPSLPLGLATDSVPDLLGRPPLSFDAWAEDHADQFR